MKPVLFPVKKVAVAALSVSLVMQSFPTSALARLSYDAQGTALAPASSTWIADQLATLAEQEDARDAAQTKVNQSNTTITSLQEQIAVHENAITETQATVSQRTEEAEQAQAQADDATTDLEAAQKAYDENGAAVADAQTRVDELEKIASGDLSDWEQAVTDAKNNLINAQAALEDAQAELKKLKEQLDSGSFGFFEYYGATDALNALSNSTYADKTQKGDADDATNLDNMRDSLGWINRLNDIRKEVGLEELAVTDYLMACAQADANFSDTATEHAGQFTIGENLAWNEGADPFVQWYDEEKAYFDEAWASITKEDVSAAPTGEEAFTWYQDVENRKAVEDYLVKNYPAPDDSSVSSVSIGHYMNCINPSYTVTGFAICTRGTMDGWITFAQTFDYSGSPSFTVDDYEERIAAYESAMDEAITADEQAVSDAQATADEAEAALEKAQQELNEATAKQETAATELEEARAKLTELQDKKATLQEKLDAAQTASDDADAAATAAQDALDKANEELESLQNDPDYLQLKEELASEREKLATAEEELATATETCQQIEETIKQATDLSNSENVEIVANDRLYDGNEQRPPVQVTVTFPDESQQALAEGTDFSVAYADNINVGTATVTVLPMSTGELGQWWSTGKGTFNITPKSIEAAEAQPIEDQTFTGSAITPKVELTDGDYVLQEGADYTLTYVANTNAGKATVKVTGTGNYDGTISLPFTIVAANLDDVTISPIADQTLSGTGALTPKPVVKLGSYTLKEGTDYTLSYADNAKVGTATVVITAVEDGNFTGSTNATFKIVAMPHVAYRTHVQNVGWQSYVRDGAMSGTSGRSLRLEGINIRLEGAPYSGGIRYRTHVQNIGWQDWKYNDAMSGTSGRSLRLEAIQIELTGKMAEHYDVWYRVHAQNFGWMGWARNGVSAGSATYGYRLEGIEVVILPKGSAAPGSTSGAFRQHLIQYQTHVQNVGWQGWVYDGGTAGTSGQSLRLEGINVQLPSQLYSGGIRYRTHVQNIGWQGWKSNGAMSGTSGRSLRLEGIEIELYGQMAEHFDVWYRVHAQNFGWMGWTKNGSSAGTAGYSYRLEAIQIALLPKGSNAPGSTANAFRQK